MQRTNRIANGLEDILRSARKAIVLGVGGGGDIVGTLPTARFLDLFGISSILGGLSWERFVYDPEPGTRALSEVRNVQPLASTVWLANSDTATHQGVRFAESEVAAVLATQTLLVDLSEGVAGLVAGLRTAMAELEADLLVGVDVGGDSLAAGNEPGLRSPLADAMVLAAVSELSNEFLSCWGVLGYGSDGELSAEEIERALANVASKKGLLGAWGVTPAVADELAQLIERVRTEASNVVLRSARGEFGCTAIRDGTRSVGLSPVCTVTFYVDPAVLAKSTPLAAAVSASTSLEEANAALLRLGIRTEYEFEKEMKRRGLGRYP
ncbi:MAG: DUF1152 domain-containing protein [Acidiferrobacterales bacterium]